MGKKSKNVGKSNIKKGKKELPFVSICTPTFNRRPFWERTIQCFQHQDYPKNKMEWIIIDDGTDSIEDLVKDIPQVKYYRYETKMSLGKKRNIMHEKSSGDILVYQDDDDYYPKNRVSHAVQRLMETPSALAAGSSEIYIWFKHIQQLYQFGPYNPQHATAGTFAFKKELLNITSYDENACLAEEKAFLKDYTIPFVQLDPLKTILVFSHEHNTFDKRKLLEGTPNPQFVKTSCKTVDDFVSEPDLKHFFMEEIDKLLEDYDPGHPKHKPDVLKQIKEIEESRKQLMEENCQIQMQQPDGTLKTLNNKEILDVIHKLQTERDEIVNTMRNYKPTITLTTVDGIEEVKSLDEVMEMYKNLVNENNVLKEGNVTNIITYDAAGNKIHLTSEEVIKIMGENKDEILRLNKENESLKMKIIDLENQLEGLPKNIETELIEKSNEDNVENINVMKEMTEYASKIEEKDNKIVITNMTTNEEKVLSNKDMITFVEQLVQVIMRKSQ